MRRGKKIIEKNPNLGEKISKVSKSEDFYSFPIPGNRRCRENGQSTTNKEVKARENLKSPRKFAALVSGLISTEIDWKLKQIWK